MIYDYKIYQATSREKVAVALGFAFAWIFCGYIFYGTLLWGILFPFFYPKLLSVYCGYQAARRKKQLLGQFRDLLFSLSSSFAAGRHMEEAIEEAVSNLSEIYGEQALIVCELLYMLRKMKETGATDISVWEDFASRSGISDIGDFTQVFRAVRETGGNLVLAVNRAAAVIGDKIAIETEIKTMISQKKLEGRLITAMPIFIVLFLQLTSPDYLAVMYESLAGKILMSLALLATVLAYVMIERITAIEV
ncbi:hypothetical protein D1155_02050 [Anaerotruncus sp. 80]|uniref:Type II secretion system protein GspF domain-containing protein n=1 Tax=Anaerotruncus colihominis TaxID=169435 RepID=A0A845QIE6_9FIRM|nr:MULTISPECIES: type II secretion system F family protein [Anaerotruncus]NBH60457.1 hypothetical protein [Anaerotruncus colihominis]NCF01111.1 hypothetical protein [Anaerotruncus sp. 80]